MSVSIHSTKSGDRSLLDQIFSAVQLPEIQHEDVHDNNMRAEQESVLAELDQVLQKQRSVSESSSPSRSSTLKDEPREEHFYDDVASEVHENHYHTIADLHLEHDREPPVPPHQNLSYESLADEEVDVFPANDVQAEIASLRRLKSRSRSQTIDSQASVTESRCGSFKVQDENGRYTGSQIDLLHDEVAYNRPKNTASKEHEGGLNGKKTPDPHQKFQSPERRQSINDYVRQVSQTKSRRSSVISLAKSLKEQQHTSSVRNGARPEHADGKRSDTLNRGIIGSSIIEEPIEFNRTVIDHLERGQLLHEINGYGIVTPSFNEFVHKKFKHFVVGNYGPVEEDEKTILLVGESHVGKSSFIYSALNYLYGVEREFDFRFAIEPPDNIHHTHDEINMYTFCYTVLGQKIHFVDTPGIEHEGLEHEHTLDALREWIKFRLTKRPQLKIDAILVFEKYGEHKPQNAKLEAKYRQLQKLFGGDIRTLTIPAYSFANNYVTKNDPTRRLFTDLPFPVDNYLLFNNAGFFPAERSSLQQLIHFKTSVASFDELFLAISYKLHPIVFALRR